MTKNTLNFLEHFFISKNKIKILGNCNGTEEKPAKISQ